MSDCRFVNASKDFFLSAMVNDDDRDAGLPKRKGNAAAKRTRARKATAVDQLDRALGSRVLLGPSESCKISSVNSHAKYARR